MRGFFRLVLATLFWLLTSLASAQAPILLSITTDASALLAKNQAEQAYRLLEKYEQYYLGDAEFDFQLGLAALESGRAAIAIFALERVVTNQPNNLRAKTELARAFAANKELAAAKVQLAQVMSEPSREALPSSVRLNLERFLSAINQQLENAQASNNQRDRFALAAEFGMGWDSNANLGSNKSEWIGAGGLTLYPSASLQGQSSSVASLGLSGNHSRLMSDRLRWLNSASIGQTWNLSRARVNMNANFGTFDLRSGIVRQVQANELSITMLAQHQRLNSDASRNSLGLNAQWQLPVASSRLAIYGQHFQFTHPGNDQRNTRRNSLGASLVGGLSSSTGFVLSSALTRETPLGVPELGFHFQSLRASVDHSINRQWKASASLGIERRNYDAVPALFAGQERKDREVDLRLSLDYVLSPTISLVPSLSYTNNHSSLAANDYRRTQYFLFARYRF